MSTKHAAGAGVVLVAVIGAPVAAFFDATVLAVLLLALPAGLAALVVLDVRRRAGAVNRRAVRWQEDVDRRLDALAQAVDPLAQAVDALTEAVHHPPARAGSASYDDLLGTVKLLQHQYEGRLDHAQASLEAAVRAARDSDGAGSAAREQRAE